MKSPYFYVSKLWIIELFKGYVKIPPTTLLPSLSEFTMIFFSKLSQLRSQCPDANLNHGICAIYIQFIYIYIYWVYQLHKKVMAPLGCRRWSMKHILLLWKCQDLMQSSMHT